MKKSFITILVLFFVAGIFATEIGYVDAMTVFQNTQEFQQEYTKLQDFFKNKQASIDAKKTQMQNEMQALQNQSELMDKTKKEEKQQELQTRYNSLMQDYNAAQQELNQKQQTIMGKFQAKLAEAVRKIAAREGYDMVVLKDAVIYANVGNDLTPMVIKEMNKGVATSNKTSKSKKKKGK